MRLITFFKERFLGNLFLCFPWILWGAWYLVTGNPFLESFLPFNWLNNAILIWWCFWVSLRFFLTIFWTALRVNQSFNVFNTPCKLRKICLDNKAISFTIGFYYSHPPPGLLLSRRVEFFQFPSCSMAIPNYFQNHWWS